MTPLVIIVLIIAVVLVVAMLVLADAGFSSIIHTIEQAKCDRAKINANKEIEIEKLRIKNQLDMRKWLDDPTQYNKYKENNK
jgi:hypothetical protein